MATIRRSVAPLRSPSCYLPTHSSPLPLCVGHLGSGNFRPGINLRPSPPLHLQLLRPHRPPPRLLLHRQPRHRLHPLLTTTIPTTAPAYLTRRIGRTPPQAEHSVPLSVASRIHVLPTLLLVWSTSYHSVRRIVATARWSATRSWVQIVGRWPRAKASAQQTASARTTIVIITRTRARPRACLMRWR
jgi:hypothetical protein